MTPLRVMHAVLVTMTGAIMAEKRIENTEVDDDCQAGGLGQEAWDRVLAVLKAKRNNPCTHDAKYAGMCLQCGKNLFG